MTGPVVLLDRDGTIIVEREYLSDPADVALERGAPDGLRRLVAAGARLLVVTNQSGVGRGYFGPDAVERVNARVAELLMEHGVWIEGWYVCPHSPDAGCDCRKPAPGLAYRAAADLGFDPADAYVVGDKASDIELGSRIGATAVLVRTGYGSRSEGALPVNPAMVADDLVEAADRILADFDGRCERCS